MNTWTFYFIDSDGEEQSSLVIEGRTFEDALDIAEGIAWDYGWTVELGE